jgi:hypothetical protein
MRSQVPSASEFDALQKRVNARYGAFGAIGAGAGEGATIEEKDPLIDNHLKPTLKLFGGAAALSAAITFVTGGQNIIVNIIAALGFAVFLYQALGRKPVYIAARTLLALALFLEAPQETPTWWTSPLREADFALFASLKDFIGLPGGSLPIFFFACIALIVRGRKAIRKGTVPPPPRLAIRLFSGFLVVLGVLELWGLARGGAVSPSFFQILQLMTMPVCGIAFLYSFRGTEDLGAIGTIIVSAAAARSLFVMIMYVIAAAPFRHEEGFFVTTHSDSILFVAGVTTVLAYLLEHRKRRAVLIGVALIFEILIGIALNNRRLAFVSLGFLPVMVFLSLKPSKVKRRVTRIFAVIGVIAAAYFMIGSQIKDVAAFAPARGVLAALNEQDTSAESRDIENYNLIVTMREAPVLGSGFGWEYHEKLKVFDIEELFSLYRYIPHNGVLWLWTVGGVIGFAAIWFLYPVSAMLAVRVMRRGRTAAERAAGLACLGISIAAVTQAWGDQGFHSYLNLVLFSLAVGIACRLDSVADTPLA